jgi:transcriptional regulator with XRE-family HTH domain
MTPQQSRMARAALKWSLTNLAEAAGVGRPTAARFEFGEAVEEVMVTDMRKALEVKRIQFVDEGRWVEAFYCWARRSP